MRVHAGSRRVHEPHKELITDMDQIGKRDNYESLIY